jgi:hypothetical protein
MSRPRFAAPRLAASRCGKPLGVAVQSVQIVPVSSSFKINDLECILWSYCCKFNYLLLLAAICSYMRDSTLKKGIIPTISRSEQSNRAQIRVEPVIGHQKPIYRKSQKVFDFIEVTGLFGT